MAGLSWMNQANGTNQIAQAGQWSQQYGGSNNNDGNTNSSGEQNINPSWEIARKALEKVQGATGESTKISPTKKATTPKQNMQQQSSHGDPMQQQMFQGMHPGQAHNMGNSFNAGNYYNPIGQHPGGMFQNPYGFNYGMNPYGGNMMAGGNQYPPQSPRQMYPGYVPQYTSFEGGNFQQSHMQHQQNNAKLGPGGFNEGNNQEHQQQGESGFKQGNRNNFNNMQMKYNNKGGFNQNSGGNKGGNQAASQPKQPASWMNKNQAPGSGNIRFNFPSQRRRQPNFVGFNQGANELDGKDDDTSNIDEFNQQQQHAMHNAGSNFKKKMLNKTPLDKQNVINHAVKKPNKPTAAVSPGEWPESLKNYVQRAFASCESEGDKDIVESTLKQILTSAFKDNSAWSKNWDREPLPLEKAKINQLRSSRWDSEAPSAAQRQQQTSLTPTRKQTNQNRGSFQKSPGLSRTERRPYSYGFRRPSRSRSRSRSRSWDSRSRSRSRSRSPFVRKSRRRRSGSTSSNSDSGFIPVSNSWGKGQGRGRGKGRGRGGKNQGQQYTPGKKGQKNKKGQLQSSVGLMEYQDDVEKTKRMQKRAARFCDMMGKGPRKQRKQTLTLDINTYLKFDDGIELNDKPILGTSQSLTKQYLRLTSAPHPSTVRPVAVLQKSLQMVKQRWQKNADYNFVCEQLKSIRQDLTIQCVRNKFAVEVYETHARIALEKGDREEFNQCQTQLKALYLDHPGPNTTEFTAYRILYQVVTKNTLEMANLLGSLTKAQKADEIIKHALAVNRAWAYCNYHRLFLLYKQAPRMTPYMMDLFIDRERKVAVQSIIKSYRPHLPVSFVEKELAFEDTAACVAFLTELSVTMTPDQSSIDCKQSMSVLQAAPVPPK
ncbi:leukocyte receptor cluster member 8 homolog [Antedon mediterranea]|uniref:leukocyte receptor cluster member 8 homolog n=1 Tax=Antedon mediterranea TaxID=105859 RepID=UPI003AF90C57